MMRRARSIVLLVGAMAIAAVFACPPYMVIDLSAPTRHAALGHHPRWQPPASAVAEEALAARFGPVPAGTSSSPRVAVNKVRLGLEAAVVIIGTVVAWTLRPGRRSARQGRPS